MHGSKFRLRYRPALSVHLQAEIALKLFHCGPESRLRIVIIAGILRRVAREVTEIVEASHLSGALLHRIQISDLDRDLEIVQSCLVILDN